MKITSTRVLLLEAYHVLRRGFTEMQTADPRAIGFLLGALQFAGGWFLLFPFARLVPPFIKLFAVLPPFLWAFYFIVSGLCIMLATCLPEGNNCGRWHCLTVRYNCAAWSFFNWMFLTLSSVFTIAYLRAANADTIIYGIAIAFYPVLTGAAMWKVRRLRDMEREAQSETMDSQAHITRLRDAARHNRIVSQAAEQGIEKSIEQQKVADERRHAPYGQLHRPERRTVK